MPWQNSVRNRFAAFSVGPAVLRLIPSAADARLDRATPGKTNGGGSSFHWSRQPSSRATSLPQARSRGHKIANAARADQLFVLINGIMGGMASEVRRRGHVFRRLRMPTRTRACHPTLTTFEN